MKANDEERSESREAAVMGLDVKFFILAKTEEGCTVEAKSSLARYIYVADESDPRWGYWPMIENEARELREHHLPADGELWLSHEEVYDVAGLRESASRGESWRLDDAGLEDLRKRYEAAQERSGADGS
ncbi:hypothetical protein ACF07D_15780 [Leucobacter sp. NPDC015123]|uniref:hypothetical protein n=1 Tax=Leucobacter sp. NPDC015123 TaxID=3364129 RepID=UPI0036F4978A